MNGSLITVRLDGVDRQVFVTNWELRTRAGEETIRLEGRILPNVIAGVGAAPLVTSAPDGTQLHRGNAPENQVREKLAQGYRLLLPSELSLSRSFDVEYYSGGMWRLAVQFPLNTHFTFVTRAPWPAGVVGTSATVSNPPDDPFYIPEGQTLENHPAMPEGYRLLRVSERNLKDQPEGVLIYWNLLLKWTWTSESINCRRIWYAIRIDNWEPKKRKRPLEM